MSHKFVEGNCVRVPRTSTFLGDMSMNGRNDVSYSSNKILTKRDIKRGYIFVQGVNYGEDKCIPLEFLNHGNPFWTQNFRYRHHSLRGKHVEMSNVSSFWRAYKDDDTCSEMTTTYLSINERTTLVEGWMNGQTIFFLGINGNYMKAKTYIRPDGVRVGYYVELSEKKKEFLMEAQGVEVK